MTKNIQLPEWVPAALKNHINQYPDSLEIRRLVTDERMKLVYRDLKKKKVTGFTSIYNNPNNDPLLEFTIAALVEHSYAEMTKPPVISETRARLRDIAKYSEKLAGIVKRFPAGQFKGLFWLSAQPRSRLYTLSRGIEFHFDPELLVPVLEDIAACAQKAIQGMPDHKRQPLVMKNSLHMQIYFCRGMSKRTKIIFGRYLDGVVADTASVVLKLKSPISSENVRSYRKMKP